MHTTFFAYQKTPMPFGEAFQKYKYQFEELNSNLKQVDISAIASVLTNTPYSFSNLGVVHPAFVQSGDLKVVAAELRKNVEQVFTFVKRYCLETEQSWCQSEIENF